MGNGFEVNKIFILESTKTSRPYLDENGSCYVFIDERLAEEKKKEFPDTMLTQPRYYKMPELCEICYSAGADSMLLCTKKSMEKFPLIEARLEGGPYSHRLNKAIALLKQTKKIKYLYELAQCQYFVPAKVEQKDDVQIFYSIARHSMADLGTMYVVFSTKPEFDIWQQDNPGWSLIKVNYASLKNICGDNDIIINPMGNQMILRKKHILEIEKNRAAKKG